MVAGIHPEKAHSLSKIVEEKHNVSSPCKLQFNFDAWNDKDNLNDKQFFIHATCLHVVTKLISG